MARAATSSLVRRHRLSTRIWHWANAAAVFVLLMSGLMILNAHPRLYWGEYGANHDRAWLEIGSTTNAKGFVRVGSLRVETTGLLGYRTDASGQPNRRAFPGWATIPSRYDLAAGRRWHFFFAWILATGLLAYGAVSLANRHWRDLAPTGHDLAPRHLWQAVKDHARLRFPAGEAALGYNSLQKLSYFGVIALLLPLVILSGLGMSPNMDAAWPWLLELLGGRQSARSIHFIGAMLIALFILVHLAMVVLAGPYNEVRAMITGWYRLPPARQPGVGADPAAEAAPGSQADPDPRLSGEDGLAP
jgi:thiosulfate reductase cytochrome b subunit